jgi:hypothetical protein
MNKASFRSVPRWYRLHAGMALPAGLALLALAVGASSCQKRAGATIKPTGYLVASELSGGGNTLRPKADGMTFVVVCVDVPVELLMPTEAEYQTIRAREQEQKKNDAEAKDKDKEPLARDRYRILDPRRFTVVLADGRGERAEAIAYWEWASLMGFHDGTLTMSITKAKPTDKEEREIRIAVAIVVKEAEAKPPFRLQLDREVAQRVPNTELKLP